MLTRLRQVRRDERGMSMVYVGMGFMAFLSATTLAIDVGMFMTARTQAQTSADAGALAGAVALAFNDFNDRSSSGPAVQSALNSARPNQVISGTVSVTPADVTFPTDPSGYADRVKVDVYRTAERANPVPTLMGSLFGVQSADVVATATAEASPANSISCVKPFIIPDRWTERRDPPWTTSSTFDRYYTSGPNKGQLMSNPDVYIPRGQPGYNGYDSVADKGTELVIRAGTGNNLEPTMYYSWKMPGDDIGADFYRNNISH